MKSSILITLPSLLGLAIATPAGTPVRRDGLALEGRQAGTTIIPACATLTSTATPTISALELYEATLGCTGVQATGTNDTRNDILNGICKPFTLIFARGTGEDPNLGNLVGPPFIYALNATFGTKNVAVQGVNNYPADDAGFCAGGSSTGTADLVTVCPPPFSSSLAQSCISCHKTTLILSQADRTNPKTMPLDQTLRLRLQPRRPSRARRRRPALFLGDKLHQLSRPLR